MKIVKAKEKIGKTLILLAFMKSDRGLPHKNTSFLKE